MIRSSLSDSQTPISDSDSDVESGTACEHRHDLRSLTDGELLGGFRHGEEATSNRSFAELVRRHQALVLGVCRRILRDEHAAEDAFQATFLVLARKAHQIRQPKTLAPWLYRVAYRIALRAKQRQGSSPDLLEDCESLIQAERQLRDIVNREACRAVDEELQRLPENQRRLVLLCSFEGMSYGQAARRLGLSHNQVKWGLSRAREALRIRLGRRGFAFSVGMLSVVSLNRGAEAVQPTLVKSTVSLAQQFACDPSSVTPGSSAVSLAYEGLQSMLITKLKTTLLLVAAALLMTAGPVWLATSSAATPGWNGLIVAPQEDEKEEEKKARQEAEKLQAMARAEAEKAKQIAKEAELKAKVAAEKARATAAKLVEQARKEAELARAHEAKAKASEEEMHKMKLELAHRRDSSEQAKQELRALKQQLAAMQAMVDQRSQMAEQLQRQLEMAHVDQDRVREHAERALVERERAMALADHARAEAEERIHAVERERVEQAQMLERQRVEEMELRHRRMIEREEELHERQNSSEAQRDRAEELHRLFEQQRAQQNDQRGELIDRLNMLQEMQERLIMEMHELREELLHNADRERHERLLEFDREIEFDDEREEEIEDEFEFDIEDEIEEEEHEDFVEIVEYVAEEIEQDGKRMVINRPVVRRIPRGNYGNRQREVIEFDNGKRERIIDDSPRVDDFAFDVAEARDDVAASPNDARRQADVMKDQIAEVVEDIVETRELSDGAIADVIVERIERLREVGEATQERIVEEVAETVRERADVADVEIADFEVAEVEVVEELSKRDRQLRRELEQLHSERQDLISRLHEALQRIEKLERHIANLEDDE